MWLNSYLLPIDQDGDGQLSEAEQQTYCDEDYDDDDDECWIYSYDTNSDSYISRDEYVAQCVSEWGTWDDDEYKDCVVPPLCKDPKMFRRKFVHIDPKNVWNEHLMSCF